MQIIASYVDILQVVVLQDCCKNAGIRIMPEMGKLLQIHLWHLIFIRLFEILNGPRIRLEPL